MKKIILSLAVIAVVATVAVGATRAFFSSTVTSVGNTISAGTIDISVDGGNWANHYATDLADMKPGMTRNITFTVHNTGTNPLVLRKQLGNFVFGSTLGSDAATLCANHLVSGTVRHVEQMILWAHICLA